ncbi:PEP-CTERM sorting domain-containing protein [Cerasicoccus frondis]|uniref:PEP-CTERM sorting domain-containing protein n=1 Tax=Cerasicoccus frondis TaxID=490090 RepID=UPI00285255E9|nr:PEP-CTERM sorting domain-containing protein [Cerasicoccus frondis]
MKKNHPFSFAGRSAIIVAAASLMTASAQANVLVYDGFDYTPGSDMSGQNGGSGWSNGWFTSGSYTATSGSLAPSTLLSENGYVAGPSSGGTFSREYGTSIVGTGDEELWFSFAMNRAEDGGGSAKKLTINPFSTTTNAEAGQFLGIFSDNNTTDAVARIRWGTSAQIDLSSTFTLDVNIDYFVYGQVVFTEVGTTTFNLWVVESSTDISTLSPSDPATATVVSTSFSAGSQNSLDTWATSQGVEPGNFDEFRIGDTFSDVVVIVPEPSTYALLGGMLVLGLTALRRRK